MVWEEEGGTTSGEDGIYFGKKRDGREDDETVTSVLNCGATLFGILSGCCRG